MCASVFNSDVCRRLKCPLLFALRFNRKPLNSAAPQMSLLECRMLCSRPNGIVQFGQLPVPLPVPVLLLIDDGPYSSIALLWE